MNRDRIKRINGKNFNINKSIRNENILFMPQILLFGDHCCCSLQKMLQKNGKIIDIGPNHCACKLIINQIVV